MLICFAQRCIYVQNRCCLCPKSRLNLAKRWLFTSVIQDTNVCWLKIVNHWDNHDNGVMSTGKEIKSGLKSVRIKTDVATHTFKLLLRKIPQHNLCEIKVCPKTWAYFTLKLGWLKTNVGTNIGPQNNMYLSAPARRSNTEIQPMRSTMGVDSKIVFLTDPCS